MLDPDEMEAYEFWKRNKLLGQVDLTVGAFNAEMGALARAWDEGRTSPSNVNPYRQPGMTGHVATRSTPLPITEQKDEE